MMDHGGFNLRNLLSSQALAVLAIFFGAVVLLGIMHLNFAGSVVI